MSQRPRRLRAACVGRLTLLLLVPAPLGAGLARAQNPSDGAPADHVAPAAREAEPLPSRVELLRRIEALEQAVTERTPSPGPPPVGAPASTQNAFNPEISIITDLTFAAPNLADREASALALPGLLEQSDRGGKLRGINFNYFELVFNAAVDPYFDFFGVLTLEPDGLEIEEAYIDLRSLPFGCRLRVGKFLSAFGRLNGLHKHLWDFNDPPLIYEGLIGGEGLKNPGVRLSWTAPLDYLLQAHAEVYQGAFDQAPTFNAAGFELSTADGATLSAKAPAVPVLYIGSLKTSFDVGDHVLLLGGSLIYGHSTQSRIEGLPTDMALSAPGTLVYDAELTYKYLLSSYRSITWQTEYLGRLSSGRLALASDGAIHEAEKRQGGGYSELIWRFDAAGQWRVGGRLDLLTENVVSVDDVRQPLQRLLPRYAAMLEFSPSEYSRFRLQYDLDRSRFLEGAQRDVHELLLQVNIAVGPHGAHAF
ncbi:MAG: hypothetical protein IPL40_09195 [Proteobacteria bacterium]|nr:hypothetical protein [Pseudomonadota bacterium]